MSVFLKIQQNLCQIKYKATQLPVFGRNRGVTVEDPAYWRNIDELNLLAQQLKKLMHQLTTAEHQFDFQQKNIPRSIQGQDRLDMKYRIGQRKAEAFRLMLEAQRLKDMLDDLRAKNGETDFRDGAERLAKTGYAIYDSFTTHVAHDIPALVPQVSPPGFDASPEKAILAVILTLDAFISYIQKKRRK